MAKTQEQELLDLQLEKARLDKELAGQALELQREQLEDLKRRNAEAQQRRKANEQASASMRTRMAAAAAERKRIQRGCKHRMGGKNLGGFYNGSMSTTFAVEYNAFGLPVCRCIRCDKTVRPGEPGFEEIFNLPRQGLESAQPVRFGFVRTRVGNK